MCQSSGRNLDHSLGSNALGSVSTDSPSIFKWPVIAIGEQIKMDFRWRFIGRKQTWACCFWPSSLITHHLLHAYMEINSGEKKKRSWKVLIQLFYKSTKSWQKNKGGKREAHSSLIIDGLAKLTRQVRNPGYNLWDKYFIANICLCILCQRVLKLLQMNVKRKVSEQAVEGLEQRRSSAGRREKEEGGGTEQQTIFLGSSHKLNMQLGGLYSIAVIWRGVAGESMASRAPNLPQPDYWDCATAWTVLTFFHSLSQDSLN